MPLSPKGLIETAFMLVFIIVALGADFGWFTSPAYANKMNSTATYINGTMYKDVWQPTQAIAYNKTNGFNAQILSFTGLAFVFSGIGTVMNQMLNVPGVVVTSLSTSVTVMGLSNLAIVLAIPMAITFLGIFITMMGILTWMKAGFLWSGAP